ncbi:MAG: hypothetical protein NZ518_00620 [Dehalococcoidia bacterium]|nr:hypothetical protein [Dehalococcoidia bacterium]
MLPAIIDTRTKEDAESAISVASVVESFAVTSETYDIAVAMAASLNERRKLLEQRRKELTAPIDDAKAGIIEFFRPALDALAHAERVIKGKIADYNRALQRERERLLLEAQQLQHTDAGAAISVSAQAMAIATPKRNDIAIRKTVSVEIVDMGAFLRYVAEHRNAWSLVEPRLATLNAMARAQGDSFSLPGCRRVEKDVVAVRGRRE